MSEALDRLIEAVGRGDDTAVQSIAKGISSAAIDEGRYWPSHDAMKAYRGSLDAAMALHEALLPGWGWARLNDRMAVELAGSIYSARGPCPARAWLIAILRAYRAAQREA